MGTFLAILGSLALLWWVRDRRTPDQRLADALRAGDRAYLRDHLPPLSAAESEAVLQRVLAEVDEEARAGDGAGDWDQARFDRYEREARVAQARRRLGV